MRGAAFLQLVFVGMWQIHNHRHCRKQFDDAYDNV